MLKVYVRIFVSQKVQELRNYKRSKVNRVKLTQSVRDDGKNRCVLRRLNTYWSLFVVISAVTENQCFTNVVKSIRYQSFLVLIFFLQSLYDETS